MSSELGGINGWEDIVSSEVSYPRGKIYVLGTVHDDRADELAGMVDLGLRVLNLTDEVGIFVHKDADRIGDLMSRVMSGEVRGMAVGTKLRTYKMLDGGVPLNIMGQTVLTHWEEGKTIPIEPFLPTIMGGCRKAQIPVFRFGSGIKPPERVFREMSGLIRSLKG